MDLASRTFKALPLSAVRHEDMTSNRDTGLADRAQSIALGTCDAFLSHSWRDPSQLKWESLQKWRADFAASHGREAYVWIDKGCIDQVRIDRR